MKTDKNSMILFLIIVLIIISSYRIFIRRILDVQLYSVQIQNVSNDSKEYYIFELGLSTEQTKDIILNPENYRYVEYRFRIINRSSSKQISKLKIIPIFPSTFKDKIIYDERIDGVAPIVIKPLSIVEDYKKHVLVNINDVEEIERLVKTRKFLAYGLTGNSILDIGLNFKKVEYKQ